MHLRHDQLHLMAGTAGMTKIAPAINRTFTKCFFKIEALEILTEYQ